MTKFEDGARGPYLGAFLDNSHSQQMEGFPKAREVLKGWGNAQLQKEQREMLKASFGRMFGHQAKKILVIVEEEIAARSQEAP